MPYLGNIPSPIILQDVLGNYNFDYGTLYIDSVNNRVGIGNASPSQKLHVEGNILAPGNLSVAGSYVSPVQSFRNKIINGNFDIWQRGTSTSTDGYLADRWITGMFGTTATSSRQSFNLGQTDVPGEPTYFHRSVVSSVAGASNYHTLQQRIESVRTLAGQTATLSFWAKADASKNMAVEFRQIFGNGGSPSASVTGIGVTTCALTTSWQKFTITISIPSISGKTLGTSNDDNLRVYFWFDAGSDSNSRTNSLGQQSGTFDIAQVQLEAGSVATPFEQRPIGTELALCQRYYQSILALDHEFYGLTSISYYHQIIFSTMRATPTATTSITSQTNCSGTSFVPTSPSSGRLTTNISTTGYTRTSISGLTLSAEL